MNLFVAALVHLGGSASLMLIAGVLLQSRVPRSAAPASPAMTGAVTS